PVPLPPPTFPPVPPPTPEPPPDPPPEPPSKVVLGEPHEIPRSAIRTARSFMGAPCHVLSPIGNFGAGVRTAASASAVLIQAVHQRGAPGSTPRPFAYSATASDRSVRRSCSAGSTRSRVEDGHWVRLG